MKIDTVFEPVASRWHRAAAEAGRGAARAVAKTAPPGPRDNARGPWQHSVRRLLMVACWATCGIAGAAAAVPASQIDWAGDIEFCRRELPQRHKNLFFQTERAVFEGRLAALAKEAGHLADFTVALRLQEIVVGQGDDHSGVNWRQFESKTAPAALPMALYWFSDGWRVLGAPSAQADLLGRKVVALNGVPMTEVERRVARFVSLQPMVVKSRLPSLLVVPEVLRSCDILRDDRLRIRCEDDVGGTKEVGFPLSAGGGSEKMSMASFRPTVVPLGSRDQRSVLWSTVLGDRRIFYAQYNRCEGRETAERRGDHAGAAKLPSLEALFATLLAELTRALETGSVDTFVFDLRHNSGGASDFGTRFVQKAATLAKLRQPGSVYVIMGRRTFSSAIINAGDCQRSLGALLVGEPTGGTPNHYGEVKSFTLPSSQVAVYYSTKYFGRPGAKIEPFQPDIPAEMSFADYRDGVDRPLEAIVRHREERRRR